MNEYTWTSTLFLAACTLAFSSGCSQVAVCGQGCTWTAWNAWNLQGECSVTCNGGSQAQIRNRTCIKASTSNVKCNGTSTECGNVVCGNKSCTIDGNWGPWGSWQSNGTCLDECNGCLQIQNRIRTCDSPRPENNGKQCIGPSTESRTIECDREVCPLKNGNWTDWSQWIDLDSCSATCGGGTRPLVRSRTCTNPPPQNGGLRCDGASSEYQTIQCNIGNCSEVDGYWSAWTNWSPNETWSGTCGKGTRNQARTRSCIGITPQSCGRQCNGSEIESQIIQCNKDTCPPECSWNDNVLRCNIPSSAYTRTVVDSRSSGSDCNLSNCTCDDIFYGYIRHPTYCTHFILCAWNTPFIYACENGTYWDQSLQSCAKGTC
ncbi:hypothetical protein ACJMK2_015768 [Sinanodonta woodiana]|uniref:Chitin-binding type-2 domain-containing protein n=1 Tax=Sinanodonta woodiana TaxID=1069815 RepID=A0ABD3URG2_SINWO